MWCPAKNWIVHNMATRVMTQLCCRGSVRLRREFPNILLRFGLQIYYVKYYNSSTPRTLKTTLASSYWSPNIPVRLSRPNLYAGVWRWRSAKPPELSFTVSVGRSATELSQLTAIASRVALLPGSVKTLPPSCKKNPLQYKVKKFRYRFLGKN